MPEITVKNLSLRFNAQPRTLVLSSVLYLALPYVLFFLGWLKWYFAVLSIGLLAIPLLDPLRARQRAGENDPGGSGDTGLKLRHIVLVLVSSAFLLAISGVGGIGYQDTDWPKHNAILKDLVEQPWPVVYERLQEPIPLVYYFAYYLPAAALGKLGGWSLANQALFLWTWIGLVLAMLWFLVLARRASFAVVLLFVLFSGLDVIGEWLVTPQVVALRPEYQSGVDWGHIERWAFGWEYSSNVTGLFWVPNQALAGWIATGLLVYAISHSRDKRRQLYYCGLTILWSPFVTFGLAPFLLADWIAEQGTWLDRLRHYMTLPNLCGGGLLAIVALFYSAKLYLLSSLHGGVPQGFSLAAAQDRQAQVIGFALILVFCLLEFGLYSILIYGSRHDWNRKMQALFAAAMISLTLIPFYRFGAANDFAMRASIPSLFVLAILLTRALQSKSLATPWRLALVALVVIGAVTPAIEFRRHVSNIVAAGTIQPTQRDWGVRGLWDLPAKGFDTMIPQYVGSSQAPFFTFMVRDP